MRSVSLLFIFCFISLLSTAQDFLGGFTPATIKQRETKKTDTKVVVSLPDKPNVVDANGRKQGEWAKKYPNGRYAYTATFEDDKPVGEVRRFYPSGKLSMTLLYDEADTCRVKTFHENGNTESVGQYFAQKREGFWWLYSATGFPLAVSHYVAGEKHGVENLMYEDGRLLEMITWVDGRKEGPYSRYFASGMKEIDATYHNDEFNGHYRSWASDGDVQLEGEYASGVKVGKWSVRYPDANNLRVIVEYDKHGLIVNRAEVDSVENLRLKYYEKMRGRFDDPERYMNNPEDYVPFK